MKLFWHNLHNYLHISNTFDCGCAESSVIMSKKCLKLDICVNFTNLFWHNLHNYLHISYNFDWGYVDSGIIMLKKVFNNGFVSISQTNSVIIYTTIHIFPIIFTEIVPIVVQLCPKSV